MTAKCAICVLAFGLVCGIATPAAAGEWHHPRHHRVQRSEPYVPAGGDIVEFLFGGPRYYDRQMSTTAAGPCAYDSVGPDANAVNDVNDHYCGK